MRKISAVALSVSFLVVAGCAKNNHVQSLDASVYNAKNTTSEEQKKPENWIKLVDGSDLMYEESSNKLSNGDILILNKVTWNEFLRKFIESLPKEKRDASLKTFLRCTSQYDELEKRFIFDKTIRSSDYMGSINISGVIKDNELIANLKLEHDLENVFTSMTVAQKHPSLGRGLGSFKIYADDFNYERAIEFNKEGDFNHESGKLGQLNSDSINFLEKLANAKKSTIRYNGSERYYDFILGQKEKDELKLTVQSMKDINEVFSKIGNNGESLYGLDREDVMKNAKNLETWGEAAKRIVEERNHTKVKKRKAH
jgi:hypothetical protein